MLSSWSSKSGFAHDIMSGDRIMVMKAYCVKERKSREMVSPKAVKFGNGRHALKGKCASCGTTLFRITGK